MSQETENSYTMTTFIESDVEDADLEWVYGFGYLALRAWKV